MIRPFTTADLPLLTQWWNDRNEVPPTLSMMPEGTSYVFEAEDKPVASMCFITTNCRAVAYCAHFISDRHADKIQRREAVKTLFDFIRIEAKNRGYENLLAFGYQEKLTERFKSLGFKQTSENLNSFVLKLS